MPAVTTLDHKIAHEERVVGMRTDRPLTDSAITHRRLQIAVVLAASGFVALFAVFFAKGELKYMAIAIAVCFAVYAVAMDRHLRRLASLRGDSQRITLVVAGELMYSGALAGDRELLDLRDHLGRASGLLAAGLAELLRADCTRVRLIGPSGEVPIAAERELAARRPVPRDAATATEAMKTREAVRAVTTDNRGILVVPMFRGHDQVCLLEAVAPPDQLYSAQDAAVADAYARGAVAAMLAPK